MTSDSAWNTAGTWEEKKLNKNQVEEYFNKKMKETPFEYKNAFKLSNISGFSGDVRIIIDTVKAVIKREGISAEGQATMCDFVDYVNEKKKALNEV